MTSLTKKKVFLKIQIWFQNFTLQEAFVCHRNFTKETDARMSDCIYLSSFYMLIIALGGGAEAASLEFWNFHSNLWTTKEKSRISQQINAYDVQKKQKFKNNILSDS